MEVSEEVMDATQQQLGALITRPKLSSKLLSKPPFRFLHDIVSELASATGFAAGLYSGDELDARAIADKQAKIDFLNKIIACVGHALGAEVDVSANKIVAGREADRTNFFLQVRL